MPPRPPPSVLYLCDYPPPQRTPCGGCFVSSLGPSWRSFYFSARSLTSSAAKILFHRRGHFSGREPDKIVVLATANADDGGGPALQQQPPPPPPPSAEPVSASPTPTASTSANGVAPGSKTSQADNHVLEHGDYRVAVYGAGGVGKSSIILRFVKGVFSDNYVPTIEDTYQQVITCNQKNVCTLEITDTTGSHQFPAMQRLSIQRGHAFVIVYSVTSRQSLEELGPIVKMLKEVKGDQLAEIPIMLVGNKSDEGHRREVKTETGAALAARWGTAFVETSAKNNENITELFQKLLTLEKKRQLTLGNDDGDGKAGNKKKCSIM